MEGIRLSVKDLNQRVVKSQENVATIIKLINKWNEMPLFRRIDRERTEPLLDIEGKELKDIFCLVMRHCITYDKTGTGVFIKSFDFVKIRNGRKETGTLC